MKILLLLILLLLTGCTTFIVNPDGCSVKSVRRVAVTCGDSTLISGQILIDDKTVQVLAGEVLNREER